MKPPTHFRTSAGTPKRFTQCLEVLAPKLMEEFGDGRMEGQTLLLYNIDNTWVSIQVPSLLLALWLEWLTWDPRVLSSSRVGC